MKLGTENNFAKYSDIDIDTLKTSYEYGSVMHYDAYTFSFNGLRTIIPRGNFSVVLGQRVGMTSIDILEVQRYYGCLPIPNSSERTNTISINSIILLKIIFVLTY